MKERRQEENITTEDIFLKEGLPSADSKRTFKKIPDKFENDKGLPSHCNDNVWVD